MFLGRRFAALNAMAVAVGVMAGLAAVVFRYTINLVEGFSFRAEFVATASETRDFITSPWGVAVILVPAAGGLFIGLLRLAFPKVMRQGISEVMAAVQARG
ncbi:MAG TPA: hypothetical protein VI796_01945, partial [Candidatus Thermoplasmatota archaeon]|nr:hypothetical protein [Candidatus Thermoplasmatota archaeon]